MDNQSQKKRVSKIWMILSLVFMVLFISAMVFDLGALMPWNSGIGKDIESAGAIVGLEFTPKEIEMMEKWVAWNLKAYREMRKHPLANSVAPALRFDPLIPRAAETAKQNQPQRQVIQLLDMPDLEVPGNLEELAFAPVTVLARLIRARKITSVELTRMYINRLKRYDPVLKCVITLTEDLAMEQARRADKEIAAGKYRGPLHGIPWGVKDLFATKGIKTTWGAMPYKDQVFDTDATVVERLEQAGAVLVAKLTTGALASGDVWFGGKTRNPWNTEKGSSGSSAGPASATSAGLVGFAIGTETWGSIVSPCNRCGVTGLRPTFGSVSRYGAMALSWSMDKVGPICRGVEDCALVFNAIYGPDGKDISVVPRSFRWDPSGDVKTLRIGYLERLFNEDYANKANDKQVLETLRSMGIELVPIELPDFPLLPLTVILGAEAAAAFDELTRSGKDDLLVRQTWRAWPNDFRCSRLIPAVEYIQANRFRTLLTREMAKKLKNIDVYIAPTYGGNHRLLTNLTGHPAVVVPNGFDKEGNPTSITFMGNMFKEAETLLVAAAYQDAAGFHKKHPDLANVSE